MLRLLEDITLLNPARVEDFTQHVIVPPAITLHYFGDVPQGSTITSRGSYEELKQFLCNLNRSSVQVGVYLYFGQNI